MLFKNRKAVCADLKKIYSVINLDESEFAKEDFANNVRGQIRGLAATEMPMLLRCLTLKLLAKFDNLAEPLKTLSIISLGVALHKILYGA